MNSTDLLDELKLYDYYPQKLSFSEAIKLRGESQNGGQDHYGLEIVRKLLMFDSTAVVSVTTEINKHLNNTANTEREATGQRVLVGARLSQKGNIVSPRMRDKGEQSQQKLHPMDLLVVVMNCCDDFLRQVLVEKMFTNKLSIPILLPDVRNGSYTLLLLALRRLVPEVQDIIREGSSSLTDTLVDIRNSVVSFIRVGNLRRSKSKLVNDLLNPNSFNTFFHRECANGSAKRLVSNGSIEAAWFQSETATEEEFNCRFFTALNLRGDAREHSKQTQFLCQSSTLTVFMVDSFESFKELYENVLKNIEKPQTNVIVSCNPPVPPTRVDDNYFFKFLGDLNNRGVISRVMYDWFHGTNGTRKMSDVDFTNDLREMISELLKPKHGDSDQMPTYANICRSGNNLGFSIDEDKSECKSGKGSADEFVNLVLNQPPACKPMILPLQGEPWEKFGKLEREQQGKSQNKNQDEHFIAEKETEKRRQREIQCLSLIQQNEITLKFYLQFHCLQDHNLLYFLDSCKIKLDARSRVIRSNIMEEYEKGKQEKRPQLWNEEELGGKLRKTELKMANSTIGLEHMIRELGQMYEAVISEEIRMKEEFKNARLTPDIVRNFPTVVARLLLMGQPLELMDGDASNLPITWLKAVLDQIRIMTNNAKVFVLSIVGVQSSGKSTLLNALFGLQCPVGAGRCTKGICCNLIPVDKGSLEVEYDYVLVVDTEGLKASVSTENSTFRDNELATFAIGLADATIINMKGENWSEMKEIMQIAAYGLVRIRKTKADLKLMPRCMFVHQNVLAADAKEKNRLDQEKQLLLLDNAIKAAGHAEGLTEINRFNQVIWYDTDSYSWYFPEFSNGRTPKSRISQGYIAKVNELRQYLVKVMKDNPSKLTISSFFFRMSDLWNAMLHNDFVLCFRNTQEIIAGMVLNDRISHEVDRFKTQNKLEQTNIRESICIYTSVEKFRTEKDSILRQASAAVEKNFTDMKTTLQDVINATDICASLKRKYDILLNEIKDGEHRRISNEMSKDISVHMRKLEYDSDQGVKDLKTKLSDLEKCCEDVEKEKLIETEMKEFEERWHQLIADNKMLVDERMNLVEREIKETIRRSIAKLNSKDKEELQIVDWAELFKKPLVVAMPQVTENDIIQNHKLHGHKRWVMDLVFSKSYVYKAKSSFHDAHKKWELQFQNHRDLEFDGSHLEQVMFEVGQLLGISWKEECEVPPGADEICSILPPGYSFKRDYIIGFIKFACHYTYNRSLENSQTFISLTDPLADIDERRQRSISNFRQMSAKANIDFVSQRIFDYAVWSFVRDLGELIKSEVCKEDNENPTFKSKRAFLTTILIDLAQQTNSLADLNEEKKRIFKEFMLYVELAETETSETFFFNVMSKLLTEKLTKKCENAPETEFQKMVRNNVGKVVEKAKSALRQAETNCKGCGKEYVRIFKDYMNVTSEIHLRINILSGFTEAVVEEIDNLYTDFLSKANSSFETLVGEEDKAAIRPLFEKIMGCREKCPFCSAPCSQSLQQHAGEHRAIHYPMGVSGTVDIWSLFTDTYETNDATEEKQRKPRKLTLSTCQAMVGSRVDIRTRVTVNKATKWYQSDYQPFKKYKEMDEYKDWDIPYSRDHNASLYWKWFMAQFAEELAEHYKALCPVIPEAWQTVTWEEAKKSLDEPELYSYFDSEDV